MNRAGRTKNLTLHKETLRRVTRELTERQLAKVLGGDDVDGGAMLQATNTSHSLACER